MLAVNVTKVMGRVKEQLSGAMLPAEEESRGVVELVTVEVKAGVMQLGVGTVPSSRASMRLQLGAVLVGRKNTL